MNKPDSKPAAFALCTALVGGLALSGSAFSMQPLAQGYLQAAAVPVASKAAEGKCGVDHADSDKDGKVSRAEFSTARADQAEAFDGIDSNQDGFLDSAEVAAHHASKPKTDTEGKCGEGKCGEGKCGGSL